MCLMLSLPYTILSIVTNTQKQINDCGERNMPYETTQQARINAGLCKDCGNPRGEDGTTIRCRQCASEAARRATQRSTRVRKERYIAGLCYCGPKGSNTKKMVNASNSARKDTMKAIIAALTTSGVLLASMEFQCLSMRRCFKNLKAQAFDASTRMCLFFLVSMPA